MLLAVGAEYCVYRITPDEQFIGGDFSYNDQFELMLL